MLVDYSVALDDLTQEVLPPSCDDYQELQRLIMCLDSLERLKRQEIMTLDGSQDALTCQSIYRAIKYLSQEITDRQISIKSLIASNKTLKKQSELLSSIIGINAPITWRMMAYLGDHRTHPLEKAPSILKIPKFVQQLLFTSTYLPTIDAIAQNHILKQYYQHLTQQGESKKIALLSIMKMFLTLSYGVLTSGQALQIQPLTWIKKS